MFFDERSFSEASTSPSLETYREWASSIAGSYLSGGLPPTESLIKIAQSEELTPHQIELLAAEANNLIHTQKYASATSKYHAADFPHADAKSVIEKLGARGPETISADTPDPILKTASADEFKMWGVEPEAQDKTASTKRELKVAHEKVSLLKQKGDDRTFLAKVAAANSERSFMKQARQLALSGTCPEERMQLLGVVDHFIKTSGYVCARPALAKLAYALGREGLILPSHATKAVDYFLSKEADVKAPVELISPLLNARVVNGNHPLYISLKTFHDCEEEYRMSSRRGGLIQDSLDGVQRRVRAL